MPFNTRYFTIGDKVTLKKCKNWSNRAEWHAVGWSVRFTAGLMKQLEGHYEVVKRGEE